MAGQGRLGDKAQIQQDAHGCPGCPHPGVGPAISGSPNVLVNGLPALRVDDVGIHAVCCGPNMWQAQQGSATVFINGKAAFRKNDPSRHCGGSGKLIEGSDNVIVGDGGGGGGGGAGGGGSVGAGGGGSGGTRGGSSAAAPAGGAGGSSSGVGGSGVVGGADRAADPAAGAATPASAPGATADPTTDPPPPLKRFDLIEFEDILFRAFSAILPPDHPFDPSGNQVPGITGIGCIAACVRFASDNPTKKLLVAGHADVHPSATYKLHISSARAQMVQALVTGDRDRFADVADRDHVVKDYQQILSWVAATRQWPCDPGPIDGDHGPGTAGALARFQKAYNAAPDRPAPPIGERGVLDLATWRAFYDCYERALLGELACDEATLAQSRAGLAFIDASPVGCGNFHPTTGPYRSQTSRRVELLFFAPGEEPDMGCHVGAACLPDRCAIYDQAKYERRHVPPPPPTPLRPPPPPGQFRFSLPVAGVGGWPTDAEVRVLVDDVAVYRCRAGEGEPHDEYRRFRIEDCRPGIHYRAEVSLGELVVPLFTEAALRRVVDPSDEEYKITPLPTTTTTDEAAAAPLPPASSPVEPAERPEGYNEVVAANMALPWPDHEGS